MKVSAKKGFDPTPEYQGIAVCVDVTPLKQQAGDYGTYEYFQFVFEIDLEKEPGVNWCAWSRGFTPTLGEKSNLRRFLKAWLGRDLTAAETDGFDLESLIGRQAQLTITHEQNDQGTVRSTIALCLPNRDEPMVSCGHYVRVQDREQEKTGDAPAGKQSEFRHTGGGGKSSTATLTEKTTDPGLVKVHVGRHKGIELRDLSRECIQALIDKWLRLEYPKLEKPLTADRQLASALKMYLMRFSAETEPEEEPDDVPY